MQTDNNGACSNGLSLLSSRQSPLVNVVYWTGGDIDGDRTVKWQVKHVNETNEPFYSRDNDILR